MLAGLLVCRQTQYDSDYRYLLPLKRSGPGEMVDSDKVPDEEHTVFIRDSTLRRTVQNQPVAAPTMHFLLVREAGADAHAAARRVRLETLPVVIGRLEPAGLVLPSATISRRHCQFDLVDGRIVLSDLGSTNGTFVDGSRIAAPLALEDGALVTVGAFTLAYERRTSAAAAQAEEQDRDLQQAVDYVMSILPPPIHAGPIRADWHYQPCAGLGGDAFGYQALDERYFSAFVVDVSGHGAGAALHSVTVANVLRQRLLPAVDFRDPAAVMSSLNRMFQMEQHNWLFFTIWYGVYDRATRKLAYSSAGHHPAILARPGQRVAVGIRNPAIGVTPEHAYQAASLTVPAGSSLYVFSDGVFEVIDSHGKQWEMDDFVGLLRDEPGSSEARRLYDEIRRIARPGPLDDDFSVMVLNFA